MPQIDTPLLLDILLGLVILLFVPFGIRRGVAKEAMVSAGLLLGAILAGRFSESWGAELAAHFATNPGVARFAVSAALLLVGVFLLGYGAGAALGVMRIGTLSRLAGGLLAAFNAALMLSYLLRWIDEYLAAGAALDDGIVSDALLRRSDGLLLVAAGVLLILTVLGWVVNAARARRQPRGVDVGAPVGIPARQRPVRVAPAADAGKYEPNSGPVARSGRFGPGLDATTPLPSGVTYTSQNPWSAEGQPIVATNGHGGGSKLDSTRQRGTDSPQPQLDETVWSAWSADEGEASYARTDPADHGRCPHR